MSPSGFVSLPPELSIWVMSKLDTPRDLSAVIRSSPDWHAAFQGSRTTILAAVIENAFSADNISIAIAAHNAAQVARVWWSQYSTTNTGRARAKDATAVNKAREEFFESHPGGFALEEFSLRDTSLLLPLYRLWWIVDYFLSHFKQKALSAAAYKMKQQQSNREVTSSERNRLQRAFLRFEIYRRIFPNHLEEENVVSNEAPRYDQILPFLKWFSPWEREDILCVQEFLVDFSKDIVRTAGDHLINEFSNIAHEIIATSEAEDGPLFEPKPMGTLKIGLELHGLDVFLHDNSYAKRRFQYFVGRGLPFIKWLSCLPPVERNHAICSHSLMSCKPTFFEGLVHFMDNELATFDAQMKWPDKARAGTSLKHPNEGWRWGQTQVHRDSGKESMLQRYALREMGYVFWDTARLHGEWGLSKLIPSMLKYSPRFQDDDDWDWLHESSIEERFKDIPHPKGTMERLIDRVYWETPFDDEYPAPFSNKEAEMFRIEYIYDTHAPTIAVPNGSGSRPERIQTLTPGSSPRSAIRSPTPPAGQSIEYSYDTNAPAIAVPNGGGSRPKRIHILTPESSPLSATRSPTPPAGQSIFFQRASSILSAPELRIGDRVPMGTRRMSV